MPAEKTSFTATEIKAGVMVLASLVIIIGFIATIRGCGTAGTEIHRFYADFDSISGLNLGAEVRFGGVKAGKVVDIRSDPEDRSKIRVVFEVPADVPINHGSVATIGQVSLTTGKHLEISTGGPDEPLHASGDRIASASGAGGMLDIPDLEGVVTRLETVLDGLAVLLGVDRAQALAAESGGQMVDLAAVAASLEEVLGVSTETVASLGATVSENRDELRLILTRLVELEAAATELVTNLNATVEENREPLKQTVVNLQELTETAAHQMEELTSSLSVTLRYLQETGGNASDLLEEQRPTLEQILRNLEATTRNLRVLSQTLADQPSSLVRGGKPRGRPDGGK